MLIFLEVTDDTFFFKIYGFQKFDKSDWINFFLKYIKRENIVMIFHNITVFAVFLIKWMQLREA